MSERCPACRGKKEVLISWDKWEAGKGYWIERTIGEKGHTIGAVFAGPEVSVICLCCRGRGKVSRKKFIEEVLTQNDRAAGS
jgi:hypothetical protein